MAITPLIFEILAVDRASSKIRGVAATAEASGSRAKKAFGGLAKGALAIGGAFAAIGVAKFGAESVKSAIDFQKSSNVLVTAAGESSKNIAMVRKGLLDISSRTGTSLDQMTEGMYTVEKAGFRGANGLKIMESAAKGARDEGADLGVVTNALTSMMTAYGNKIKDPNKAMNALMVAAGNSKTSLQEYADSLGNVLPVAAKLGIGFDQVSGALGTMTASGMSARRSSQNLNHTIASLAAPTSVMAKEMSAFGLSSQDVRDNLGKRGLQGTLDLLSDTVQKRLGPAMKAAEGTISKLPKKYQGLWGAFKSGTLTLSQFQGKVDRAKDLTTKQKDAIEKALPAARGYTQAMKNMTGGNVGLATSLMLTGHSSEKFKERTHDVGKALGSTADFTKKWSMTSQTAAVSMDIARQSIKNAGTSLATKLLPAIAKGAQMLAGFVTWVTKTKGVLPALGVALGVVTVALIAMSVTPVGLAIAGIVAAIAGVIIAFNHWGAITKWFKGILNGVWTWIKSNWPRLLLILTGPFGALVLGFKTAWRHSQTFRNIVTGALKTVARAIANVLDTFSAMLRGLGHVPGFGWAKRAATALHNAANKTREFANQIGRIHSKSVKLTVKTHLRSDGSRVRIASRSNNVTTPFGTVTAFARGAEDHRAQIARPGAMRLWAEPETGGEAYIPLAQSKRGRSTKILADVANRFGYDLAQYANGGVSDWLSAKWSLRNRNADGVFHVNPNYVGGSGTRPDLPAGPGVGYRHIEAIAQQLMPGVRVTSDLRPGAVSVTGYPSLHAAGRAVDFGAGNGYSLDKIWKTWNAAYGTRLYQLLYSGEGANQIWWNHKRMTPPASIVAQHWNHVHVAMKKGGILGGPGGITPTLFDQGGRLDPGTHIVANKTGKPETVLTDEQLAKLTARGDVYVVVQVGVDKRTQAKIVQGGMAELARYGQPIKVSGGSR